MTERIDEPCTLDLYGLEVPVAGIHLRTGDHYTGMTFPTTAGQSPLHFFSNGVIQSQPALFRELARCGFQLPKKSAREAFFNTVTAAVPERICYLTPLRGWHGDLLVGSSGNIGKASSAEIVYFPDKELAPEDSVRGSLKGWKKHVARPCAASTLAVALTCIALMPILMSFAGVKSCAVSVSGLSHFARATLMRVAASVYRGPLHAVDTVTRASGGWEGLLSLRQDGLVALDVAALGRTGKQIAPTLKRLFTLRPMGVSFSCFQQSDVVRLPDEFRFVGLIMGDVTPGLAAITEEDRRTLGQEARLLELPVSFSGMELVDRLEEIGRPQTEDAATDLLEEVYHASGEDFGTPSIAFKDFIAKDPAWARSEVARLGEVFLTKAKVPERGWENRVGRVFALGFAAGSLAREAKVLPSSWSDKLIGQSLRDAYRATCSGLES